MSPPASLLVKGTSLHSLCVEQLIIGAGEFAAMLSGSIFNLHQPDKEVEQQRLRNLGKTPEEIAALPAKYFNSRCRRTIPAKDVVGPRLQAMMEKYRHAADLEGQALLTQATWTVHERQMRLVEQDLLTGFAYSLAWTDSTHDYSAGLASNL